MAAARDQLARIIRPEPEADEIDSAQVSPAIVSSATASSPATASPSTAETLHTSSIPDPIARRAPETPVVEKPAKEAPSIAPASAAQNAAPKSGKRKFILMGIAALLALAAVAYGTNYMLVGRFYVSTDDAYVRANNTMLGARVSGHIVAVLPGDNVLVRAGDVVFKIDEGDYRIAVDAVRAHSAAASAGFHHHGVRNVHVDPGHPDRLGIACGDPGRIVREHERREISVARLGSL